MKSAVYERTSTPFHQNYRPHHPEIILFLSLSAKLRALCSKPHHPILIFEDEMIDLYVFIFQELYISLMQSRRNQLHEFHQASGEEQKIGIRRNVCNGQGPNHL